MTELLHLINWWEPALIVLAVLAVVFERKLIRFERALPGALRALRREAAAFWRGDDLS